MSVPVQLILAHVPAWLMVLFRITGIFVIAPVFGSRTIPARVKILLAVGLSFCVYPMLLDPANASSQHIGPVLRNGLSLWLIGGAVAMELLVGVVIGYGASLPIMGMQVGGRVCDQQMGMGIASIFNPEIDDESGIVSQFFFILAMTVFLLVGGHRVLLMTVIGSFNEVPLGGYRPDGHLLDLLVGLLTSMFDLGLRVAAPLLCLVFLETVALGFIARTVPQMNILSIGFPLRILLGVAVLVMSTGAIAMAFGETLRKALGDLGLYFGM